MVRRLGSYGPEHTAPRFDLKDTLDKATRHRWTPAMLGAVLALHFSQPYCLLLTAGGLHSIDPEDRDRLLDAASLDFHNDAAAEREAERSAAASMVPVVCWPEGAAMKMPLDEAIWRIGEAAKRGQLQGRERGFAFSMVKLANRGGTPTPKQEKFARDLAESLMAEDEPLVEEFVADG